MVLGESLQSRLEIRGASRGLLEVVRDIFGRNPDDFSFVPSDDGLPGLFVASESFEDALIEGSLDYG